MRAYDPWSGTSGGSMAPAWSHELSSTPIGTCLLGTDRQGDVVVAAALVQGGVELMARSGTSGALLLHLWMSGLTLDALEVSADGSTIAIATGLTLRVFDAFGLTVHSETLTSSVASLALSGDGSVLAAAQSGGTRVLERASAGYVLARFLSADASAPNQALSAKVDLSDDGAALAVAHWRYTNGPRATLEFWDLTANALLWQQVEQQTNGGLQILPTAARISRDGQRAAFATWGDATQPEVLWVDRSDPAHWRAFDLPGSALALDMDARGERLVVAHKATHAQIFASTGAVLLLDAAPACLALEAPLTSSGVLAVSGFHPGASWALFLVGPKGTSSAIGGVSGSLLLQRSRLAVWAAPIDPFGRATMQWPLPLSWVGPELPFAVQVGFRTPAGTLLSPELLEPLLLR